MNGEINRPLPRLSLRAVAVWTPAAPNWAEAAAALRGGPLRPEAERPSRPSGTLLAANERRRAPETVLMALEVAATACAAAGVDPRTTPSVFASTHGDLPTTDALCQTLAENPALLSPTRFHHSVHNAASGYWAIAAGAAAGSSAVSAQGHAFAAGLFEAASLCAAEQQPVLLVAYDTEACGALASVNPSRGRLAVALVLAPANGAEPAPSTASSSASSTAPSPDASDGAAPAGHGWAFDWSLAAPGEAASPAPGDVLSVSLRDNGCADALPLLRALALGQAATVVLPPLRLVLAPPPLAQA